MMENERIAVLAGGTSCERDVSLNSGKNVLEALASKGISALWVDAVGDFMAKLKEEKVTLVFIALHGTFGEDGTIQRLLEKELTQKSTHSKIHPVTHQTHVLF